MKKLRVAPWRIIWRFLITLLVIYAAFFGVMSSLFFTLDTATGKLVPLAWDYRQPLFISLLLVIGFAMLIPTLISYYYVVESKYFIQKKFGREYQYDYANIEFIDVENSKKKNMIIFYSKTAKMRYMLGDKDGVVLDTLIKKCPNVMTLEEFRRKHPEEKY